MSGEKRDFEESSEDVVEDPSKKIKFGHDQVTIRCLVPNKVCFFHASRPKPFIHVSYYSFKFYISAGDMPIAASPFYTSLLV